MRHASLIAFFVLTALPGSSAEPAPFHVPKGFTVTQFAGDDLTHDTWAMTIADDGRVAVSGPGYIKILLDLDRDGVADKAHLVASDARNAHGLLFDGADLLSVQPHGIFRHRDTDRDGLPDAAPELFYKLPGGGGEHGPHGIRKGPDRWFYVACGNNARISEKNVTTKTSPIKKPEQGTVLRISPDGKQSEVLAHGFRNHYDLAFNKHGHLFTFDSDGERDHQLPWYSYCRVFHVRVGGHHGWLLPGHQRSFNRPPCFFDSVNRLAEIDRGSPTGVEVYRHTQFPARYRDGLFFACWTYGRVYFIPLLSSGDTYQRPKPETFLETTGNLGFAPSDIAVHPPSGDLFVAVGGRGTRGSIYRVSFPAGRNESQPLPAFEVPGDWSVHDQRITLPAPLAPAAALAQLQKATSPQARLTAIRHLMLAAGDISTSEAKRRIDAGYTANNPAAIPKELVESLSIYVWKNFPTGDREVDYELARLLAMVGATRGPATMKVTRWTPDTHPTDDAHYLFCLAQIPGLQDEESRFGIALAFAHLDRKLARRKLLTDRNWALNISEALKVHLDLDPELPEIFLSFIEDPSQAYLAKVLPKNAHQIAALQLVEKGAAATWNAEALAFVQKQLPPERLLPLFQSQWKHLQLRPALAGFLDRHGSGADKRLVADFYRPPASGLDLSPFTERLAKVDWSQGDPTRGQAAYARLTCSACHDGNTRLGPRLNGIAKRFNRDDLFRHINEPNLAVSDLYKATQITTRDGQTHVGVPVYQSESQTILETGTGETIRFSRHDILTQRRPNQSPMPPGLLLTASPADLADLYAYLKTL